MTDYFATYTIHTSDRNGDSRCFIYRKATAGKLSSQFLVGQGWSDNLPGAIKLAVADARSWIALDRHLNKVTVR